MASAEDEPLAESELCELEVIIERHRTLIGISQTYGVFTSFCVPRLLTTIRTLQRENDRLVKERDKARTLLPRGPRRG